MGIGVYSFKLVVVHQIDSAGVAVRKAENNAPVGAYCHRPEALHIALERVQVEARHTHVLDGPGLVKYLVAQIGSDAAGIILLKEPF